MREFEIIARFLMPVGERRRRPGVILGMGDDCALIRVPEGQELAVSIDTMVEGNHFPVAYPPDRVAWRALAAATSDLAAMGAEPLAFTLALTLPHGDPAWLRPFADGLSRAAGAFDIALIGGDTTRGPLTLSVQVHGTLPAGSALRRSGARPGDSICVTGTLGDAGEALHWLESANPVPAARQVLDRYHYPIPRIAAGLWLRGRATAAIDLSDGLLADLGHILDASRVGAVLELTQVPLSEALRELRGEQGVEGALVAGDDYELCFTWPGDLKVPEDIAGVTVTRIGWIEKTPGLRLYRNGALEAFKPGGYDHFGADPEGAE